MTGWRQFLLEDDGDVAALLREARRIAVLGIKPESRGFKPAHYVPRFLAEAGYEIVPVPVYYPEVSHILGRPVYRSLSAIPGPVDVVDVFRRAEHLEAHLADLLAKQPRAVWLQSGIRHDGLAQKLAEAGILVIQDRCMMVEYRRLLEATKNPANTGR